MKNKVLWILPAPNSIYPEAVTITISRRTCTRHYGGFLHWLTPSSRARLATVLETRPSHKHIDRDNLNVVYYFAGEPFK